MPRYCAETTADLSKVIIHTQQCPLFDLASLLAEGRICDIGNHAGARAVQRSLHAMDSEAEFCRHCCPPPAQVQPAVVVTDLALPAKPALVPSLAAGIFFTALAGSA